MVEIEYGLPFNRLRGINFSQGVGALSLRLSWYYPASFSIFFCGLGPLYETGRVNLLHAPGMKFEAKEKSRKRSLVATLLNSI